MWLLTPEMITTKNKEEKYRGQIPEWVFAAIPMIAAFIVWFGTTRSGFTVDDFMVIDVQSPIRSFIDAIGMFWRHDPNPQYWRPLSNSSVSCDFWLWGWNAGMFHLTNLLLHVIAVGLVYVFVRKIFAFSALNSCILAILFGTSGSHDSNLLWIAARADVLATIMMLVALLGAYKADQIQARKWFWLIVSYLGYLLALSSKEVSGVVIVLLPVLIYTSSLKELWTKKRDILIKLIPYIILTALFLGIRLQFTVPLSQMQPLTAEGSHSIAAFGKNFLYSLGYIFAPIDFRSAAFIINRYAVIGYITAVVFFTGIIFFIKLSGGAKIMRILYKPLALTIITGFVSFQSFERWRVYFPSVGALAIVIILFQILWDRERGRAFLRPVLVIIAVCFAGFLIRQSFESQKVWAEASSQVSSFERDIQIVLAKHQERPITLELITSPTKLGRASLIQLSETYLAKKAEADLRNLPLLENGIVSIPGDSIILETDLGLYALKPDNGFQSYMFKKTGENEYEISVDKDEIGLFPDIDLIGGKARRDTKLLPGETFETFGTTTTIENAEASFASDVRLKIHNSSAVHLYFDGKRIRELE
jgi:hypothetical protein